MYLQRDKRRKYWIVDIEADGLEPTVVWCVCVEDLDSDEKYTLTTYEDILAFFNREKSSVFIGHNFLGYDARVLNTLVGTRISVSQVIDTFVLSMLYSPSMEGGHSLEEWGRRVGIPKGSHEDFSQLSELMIDYCKNDVTLNKQVYLRLSKRMLSVGYSELSCEIETKAWANIQKQKRNGFAFDVPRANILLAELRQRERELKEKIYELWPPTLESVSIYQRAVKKDGTPRSGYLKHVSTYPKIKLLEGGRYECFDWKEFNLGSPAQRTQKLLELGWKPKSFTKAGNPKVDEDSLMEFAASSGKEEVAALAKWVVINARANMIENWLKVEKNGFIHGNLWLANSLRYRHSDPNTANIPSIRRGPKPEEQILLGEEGFYTYEARDLWICRNRDSRNLVGVDAKGIQLRILAHYLGNKDYIHHVVSGDPHEYTRGITGVGSRPQNKNFIYAYLLGGGAAKLGLLLGISPKEGARVKEKFTNEFPGLQRLLSRIQREVQQTGRLTLCDGARILVPEPRLALAYLLQGDESRIMKQAWIYVDEEIRRQRLDVLKVGDIHDEWQSDVLREHVEPFILVTQESFRRTRDTFRYSLPLECDARVGRTWAETH